MYIAKEGAELREIAHTEVRLRTWSWWGSDVSVEALALPVRKAQ